MKRIWIAPAVLVLALVPQGCKSSGAPEPVSTTQTTAADMPGPSTTPVVPLAGNPASVATILDAPRSLPATSTVPMSQGVDPHGEPLVSPSLVSPAPLVEPGLENSGTTSLYTPVDSARMSTPSDDTTR